MSHCYTLAELAKLLGAELRGEGDCTIEALATLQDAEAGQVAFLANPAYQRFLEVTNASAVILSPKLADQFDGNALLLESPYLGYAKLSQLLDNAPRQAGGVHPTAVVAASAQLDDSVSVGPHAVIGEGGVIGTDGVIGPGCVIGDNTVIGANCRIAANVSIYHGVSIGGEVIIHSSAVIGADGFGYAPDSRGRWEKINQLGGVVIGDRVEIGACATVDRGALGDTILADGVKIDNHVVIAHNVKVGENTAMAAFTGISGSTTIGKHNKIYQFSTVGEDTPDLKYKGEPTTLVIGDHNTIREGVTIHRGTIQDRSETTIGNHNLLMAYAHVGHDCVVGNHCILVNNVALAGHVDVGDWAILAGYAMVQQYCNIGAHSFIGAAAFVNKDVPAYVMAAGHPAEPKTVNVEGLKRRGFSKEQIRDINRAYKTLYRRGLSLDEAVAELESMAADQDAVQLMLGSVKASERGILR